MQSQVKGWVGEFSLGGATHIRTEGEEMEQDQNVESKDVAVHLKRSAFRISGEQGRTI